MNDRETLPRPQGRGSLMLEGREADMKYALVSFISKGRGETLARISRSHQALGNIIMLGRGTARSEILDYLGLELDQKEIVISHINADRAQAALQALRKKLEMDRPGHGIAFLVPIADSKGLKAIFRFAEQVDQDSEMIAPKADPSSIPDDGIIFAQHDLIIAVLHADIIEKAMDWARAAGAAGGTVMHSRDGNAQGAPLGIDEEMEILLMLVRKNRTQAILKALYSRPQIKDDGRNVILSLPVSAAIGLTHRLVVEADGSVTEQTYHV